MKKIKDKNLVILKDYVSDQFLIEQFSALYNCRPGSGHNPFTKKCHPIPLDIDRPSDLAPIITVASGVVSKDDPEPKQKVDNNPFDPTDPTDWYNLAAELSAMAGNPIESAKECYNYAPASTIVSSLYFGSRGTGGLLKRAVDIPARAVVWTAKQTPRVAFNTVATGGAIVGATWFGTKALMAIPSVAALFGAMALFADTKGMDLDIDKAEKDVIDKLKEGYRDIINDPLGTLKPMVGNMLPSTATVNCIFYAAAASFLVGRIGRNAWRYVGNKARIEKELLSSGAKLYVRKTFGRGLGQFFRKYTKSDDLMALMFLKVNGKYGGKLNFVDSGQGAIWKFEGSGLVEIPTSTLNEAQKNTLKKFIVADKVVVNVDKANDIFFKNSTQINRDIDVIFRNQAHNEIKNIPQISGGQFQGNLERLVKIMGRHGRVTPDALVENYFKATTEAMTEVLEHSKPQITEMYRLYNLARKKRPNIAPDLLRKSRELVIKDPEGSISSIVNGHKKLNNLSQRQKDKLVDYLGDYRQIHEMDRNLARNLQLAKEIMDMEAGFVSQTQTNVPSLRQFLNTPAGAQSRSTILKTTEDIKLLVPTLEEAGFKAFATTAGKFFLYPSLIGGMYFVNTEILQPRAKKISIATVSLLANKFANEKITDAYFKKIRNKTGDKIDLGVLFGDFSNFSENNITKAKATSRESLVFIQDLCREAPKNKEVDKYFNQRKRYLTLDSLKRGFIILIESQSKKINKDETDIIKVEEKDKQNEGIIKTMNKKDLNQIIKEMLNEQYSNAYGKYPYHSEEHPEDEAKDDYMEEWKALSLELIRDQSRDTAIKIAKILVKDLELFEDVLDLAGQNQSIGTEILAKLKEIKEDKP